MRRAGRRSRESEPVSIRRHLPLAVRVHYDAVRNFALIKIFGLAVMALIGILGLLLATQIVSPRSSASAEWQQAEIKYTELDNEYGDNEEGVAYKINVRHNLRLFARRTSDDIEVRIQLPPTLTEHNNDSYNIQWVSHRPVSEANPCDGTFGNLYGLDLDENHQGSVGSKRGGLDRDWCFKVKLQVDRGILRNDPEPWRIFLVPFEEITVEPDESGTESGDPPQGVETGSAEPAVVEDESGTEPGDPPQGVETDSGEPAVVEVETGTDTTVLNLSQSGQNVSFSVSGERVLLQSVKYYTAATTGSPQVSCSRGDSAYSRTATRLAGAPPHGLGQYAYQVGVNTRHDYLCLRVTYTKDGLKYKQIHGIYAINQETAPPAEDPESAPTAVENADAGRAETDAEVAADADASSADASSADSAAKDDSLIKTGNIGDSGWAQLAGYALLAAALLGTIRILVIKKYRRMG